MFSGVSSISSVVSFCRRSSRCLAGSCGGPSARPSPHLLDDDAACVQRPLKPPLPFCIFRRVAAELPLLGWGRQHHTGLPSALIARPTTKARTGALGPRRGSSIPQRRDAPTSSLWTGRPRQTANVRTDGPSTRTPLSSARIRAVINLAHVAKTVRYRRTALL